MSKSDNMLAILWMLRSGRRITAQQLAEQLEIHIRTVYRCIDSLCASGVPIIAESGPNGGYRILGHFADSPLLFDVEEQKALVHSAIFAQEAGYPYTEALSRAVAKLKHYTNEEQLDRIERHSVGLEVINPPIDSEQKSHPQLLEEAAANKHSVIMEYGKRAEGSVKRTFDPYSILHWKNHWYTIGFCRLRQQIRSFRVDRIVRMEPTAAVFERPSDFSAREALLGSLLPGLRKTEPLVTVRIQGSEHVLNELSQHWLFGHAVIERRLDEASYRLESSSLHQYVPYYLLPYGKALTILEPVQLVLRMAEVSRGIAEHYESMGMS